MPEGMEALKALREALDAGLITQDMYNENTARVISTWGAGSRPAAGMCALLACVTVTVD